jgi:glutamyl-tRNA synthetase
MRITHIVRGEEWISSTPKHVALYQAFGWELPVFIHMPLMRNADKSKISKRKNNTSIDWYREQGFLPAALLNYLALQGWSMPDGRETFSLEEFIAAFTWDRVVAGGPIFDLKRLDDLNGQYIRMMSENELVDALGPFTPAGANAALLRATIPLVQSRVNRLSEYPILAGYFFAEPSYDSALLAEKNLGPEGSKELLRQVQDVCTHMEEWTHPALEHAFRALAERASVKMRQLAEVARVPITGSKAGPPLFESMELLGRDTCLARFARALERI